MTAAVPPASDGSWLVLLDQPGLHVVARAPLVVAHYKGAPRREALVSLFKALRACARGAGPLSLINVVESAKVKRVDISTMLHAAHESKAMGADLARSLLVLIGTGLGATFLRKSIELGNSAAGGVPFKTFCSIEEAYRHVWSLEPSHAPIDVAALERYLGLPKP